MSMTDHPDFEELSAYHDGEAPHWAGHVAECEACRARLEEMAGIAAAVRRSPPAPTTAARDAAVARALAAANETPPDTGADDLERRRSPRRNPLWTGAAAVAATLLALTGTVAVLRSGTDETPTADRALTEAVPPDATSGVAPPSGVPGGGPQDFGGAVLGGELGELGDPAALVARVKPVLRDMPGGSVAPSSEAQGAAERDAPRVDGTRPCEMEARELDPGVDQVVYLATGTSDGTPVVVLGFTRRSAPDQAAPAVTLLALSQGDCRLVFSTPL